MKTFLLIESTKESLDRNIQRRNILDFGDDDIIFYYFINDPDIDSEYKIDEKRNIVYLRLPENYESQSLKLYHAFRFINTKYANQIDGVFKTSDNIKINLNFLKKTILNNKDKSYFGEIASIEAGEYMYHFGKCESQELNKGLINLNSCKYCYGYGYYINKNIIDILLLNKKDFNTILYPDVCIGSVLSNNKINPEEVIIDGIYNKEKIELKQKEVPKPPQPISRPPMPNPIRVEKCRFCDGIINEIVKTYPPNSGIPNKIYKMCSKCNRIL
jgi:hypothetical protein